MATCKENCIHYSVCGIWDRKVFVDYDKDILSDFSDLPNVEKYCRNYLSKKIEAEWIPVDVYYSPMNCYVVQGYTCSHCKTKVDEYTNYCSYCGAKMEIEGK